MRIQNDELASLSSPASRVDQVSTGPQGAGKTGGASKPQVDQVQVSSSTERIAAELSSGSAEQTARVQQLSALYASGQYSVDPAQVSRSMVGSALNQIDAGL